MFMVLKMSATCRWVPRLERPSCKRHRTDMMGDQMEVSKILNGHENIDHNIFKKIKTSKRTRGHDFT